MFILFTTLGLASEDEGLNARERRRRRRLQIAEAPATLDHGGLNSVITARMPTRAMTMEWSLGENRPVDVRHVQRLSKRFLSEGGPKREAKENHLTVLCSGDDLRRMLEKLGLGGTDGSLGNVMPDFRDWLSVNDGRKVEVVAEPVCIMIRGLGTIFLRWWMACAALKARGWARNFTVGGQQF